MEYILNNIHNKNDDLVMNTNCLSSSIKKAVEFVFNGFLRSALNSMGINF